MNKENWFEARSISTKDSSKLEYYIRFYDDDQWLVYNPYSGYTKGILSTDEVKELYASIRVNGAVVYVDESGADSAERRFWRTLSN